MDVRPCIRTPPNDTWAAFPRGRLREQAYDGRDRRGERLGALEERALRQAVYDGRRDDKRRRIPVFVRGMHELVDARVDRRYGQVLDRGEVEIGGDGGRQVRAACVVAKHSCAPLCMLCRDAHRLSSPAGYRHAFTTACRVPRLRLPASPRFSHIAFRTTRLRLQTSNCSYWLESHCITSGIALFGSSF